MPAQDLLLFALHGTDAVRGADVFVLHSLHGGQEQSVNDKLCRLLFFIGALKDSGAARVTALTPYLCYARKDRRTKLNDPVSMHYVAGLFEAVGIRAWKNAFASLPSSKVGRPFDQRPSIVLIGEVLREGLTISPHNRMRTT